MKSLKTFLLSLLMMIGFVLQAQIQITIIPASDYTLSRRDEWKVIVTNTTNQTLQVYF